MSETVIERFALRLRDYLDFHDLEEFSITFHGGEPLLFGTERLTSATQVIRNIVGSKRALGFSLQTNGTLLTNEAIGQLEAADISISLSLDGPKEANDRHRLDHSASSTFDSVFAAIGRLKARRSKIFRGVIAVIDPEISPRTLFEFFAPLGLPWLDLLLPDATYERVPSGRIASPTRYSDWLKEALQLWFSEFSALPVRWFDALLASRLGVPSPTDAMGLGAVSLIVIDTDGSYTDHDVFKITQANGGVLGRNLFESSIEEVSQHQAIREHGFRLTLAGLAEECRICPVVEACGGGSVMHRWHHERRLEAPSIYCGELFVALETATRLLRKSFPVRQPVAVEIVPFTAGPALTLECHRWRAATELRATEAATRMGMTRNGESAAALILSEGHEPTQDNRNSMLNENSGRWLDTIVLQSQDRRVTDPFLDTIRVLPRESEHVGSAIAQLKSVRDLLMLLHPTLPDAFAALISDVIFVESTVESSDRIFSFSDDTAPNVLYISPRAGSTLLGADDLGDSLLHEFLHQVLYQMEREGPMLFDKVYPRFPAPWREGLRPSGGFLHGTFVFAGLSRYWAAIARAERQDLDRDKAAENAERFAKQAGYGIQSLRQFALLTPRGEALLDQLVTMLGLCESRMEAPGLGICYSGAYEKQKECEAKAG